MDLAQGLAVVAACIEVAEHTEVIQQRAPTLLPPKVVAESMADNVSNQPQLKVSLASKARVFV